MVAILQGDRELTAQSAARFGVTYPVSNTWTENSAGILYRDHFP